MIVKRRYKSAERVAMLGLLAAFAAVLSYIETLIPFVIWIPGVKLGLANIAIVATLFMFGVKEASVVNIVRIMIVGFLFGNMFSILFSIAGAFASLIAMYMIKRTDLFSAIGVSVAGGVAHNIGQMLVSAMVVDSYSITYYIPVLIIAGIVMGIFIGIVGGLLIKYMNAILKNKNI